MKNNFEKIESILKDAVNSGDVPGLQYCLIENGEVNCGFYGYNSLYPSKTLLKGDEVYDIASLSKIISTTTITLKLIEEGLITLETKIKSILPNYFDYNTNVFELLTHQSGLPAIVSNSSKIFDKETLIKQIYNERFVYEPKSKIVYSDVGFKVLGFFIEKVKNDSLDEIAKELIFEKIGMNDTTYKPNYYRSVVTEFRDDKLIKGYVKGFVHDERSYLLEGLSGHAGVFSTASDISKYIYSVLYDEQIFNDETKKQIFNTTIIKNDLTRSLGYQKFTTRSFTNDYLITHTGFTGCNMWIDNKNKRGFVLLSNAIHPSRNENKIFSYREKILDIFYLEGALNEK